jgi:hypothetical protein
LFILLPSSLAIAGIVALLSYRRKQQDRDVMTIRQYYNYRSAR